MPDTLFGNTDSCIFYKDSGVSGVFIFLISESDGAVTRKLSSIIYQVIYDLLQTDIICHQIFFLIVGHTKNQLYSRWHIQPLRIMHSLQQQRQIMIGKHKFHCSRLDTW